MLVSALPVYSFSNLSFHAVRSVWAASGAFLALAGAFWIYVAMQKEPVGRAMHKEESLSATAGMVAKALSSSESIASWTAAAKDSGIDIVSVVVAENSSAVANESLDTWRATISLRGPYVGTKRFLREISNRHDGLLVLAARFGRHSNSDISSARSQSPLLDAQFEVAMLRRAPGALHSSPRAP